MSRQEFIDAAASEKITLVKMQATKRFVNYTNVSGDIYYKNVPYLIAALKDDQGNVFTAGTNASVTAGEFYYDVQTSNLYLHMHDNSNPNSSVLISTVEVFYSTLAASLPYDLQSTSEDVYWDGRVTVSPNFKSQIGINQNLVSTIGEGRVELINTDGALDDIYDDLIFENHLVEVYSYNRKEQLSEARLIFTGIITDKQFDTERVVFVVKDQLFNLLENVPQGVFDENDNVNSDIVGRTKRWIYGRVDGLQVQSIDQIGEGYNIAGTVSVVGESNVCTGIGTSFLSELSPGDNVFIGTQEFSIETISTDTDLILDDEAEYTSTTSTLKVVPSIPTITKNREFFVCEHATAELNRTVVNALQFNRVQLNDTAGMISGDILEFTATSERVEIKTVAPGNIVVLRQNLISIPTIGDAVVRQPIQDIYIEGVRVQSADYSINNIVGETTITIDDDAEFNIASVKNLNQSLTFTNGSRTITGGLTLTESIQSRDFIRPENVTYSTFFEVLEVTDTTITLREPFTDPTITDTAETKSPAYIGDDTIISVNLLGKTDDGTPSGEWIQTSAATVRDLIAEIGLTDRINEQSFIDTSAVTPQLVSLMMPLTPSGSTFTVKNAADLMGQSTNCALTLDNNLKLTFGSTLVFTPQNVTIVDDSDVVRWGIKSKSGKLYKFSNIRYRHGDIDRFTLEAGNQLSTHTSNFVSNYVGTAKTIEQDIYLYDAFDADIFSERILYYNSLSLAEISIETDLRLEGLEIGDVVQLEFDRLYKRFGDNASRKKLAAVSGRKISGDKITLTLTDYGNSFNTSAFITDNAALDYSLATSDDKIINGYITDTQGVVNSVETTVEINKIS